MNKKEIMTFQTLPTDVEQLRAMADMRTPFRTAALSVLAFLQYENDVQSAIDMVNFLKGPQPLSVMDTQFIRDRLRGKGYVVRSYFRGTSPANNYTLPAPPYAIEVSDNPYSYVNDGYAVLYLKSSGADSPRPVTLRLKPSTGEWFLWQHSFLADVRAPQSENPWA